MAIPLIRKRLGRSNHAVLAMATTVHTCDAAGMSPRHKGDLQRKSTCLLLGATPALLCVNGQSTQLTPQNPHPNRALPGVVAGTAGPLGRGSGRGIDPAIGRCHASGRGAPDQDVPNHGGHRAAIHDRASGAGGRRVSIGRGAGEQFPDAPDRRARNRTGGNPGLSRVAGLDHGRARGYLRRRPARLSRKWRTR